MKVLVAQSYLTLGIPFTVAPPGSSVHEIPQPRILEWVAMPFSRGSSRPRDQTHISYVSCIGKQVLYHWCHLGSPKITSSLVIIKLVEVTHGDCVTILPLNKLSLTV